jgi:DNA-binding Lrp family transcriptional regulator
MAALDDTDRFILARMTEDARSSFRGIAREGDTGGWRSEG